MCVGGVGVSGEGVGVGFLGCLERAVARVWGGWGCSVVFCLVVSVVVCRVLCLGTCRHPPLHKAQLSVLACLCRSCCRHLIVDTGDCVNF